MAANLRWQTWKKPVAGADIRLWAPGFSLFPSLSPSLSLSLSEEMRAALRFDIFLCFSADCFSVWVRGDLVCTWPLPSAWIMWKILEEAFKQLILNFFHKCTYCTGACETSSEGAAAARVTHHHGWGICAGGELLHLASCAFTPSPN